MPNMYFLFSIKSMHYLFLKNCCHDQYKIFKEEGVKRILNSEVAETNLKKISLATILKINSEE